MIFTSSVLTGGFGSSSVWFASFRPLHAALAGFHRGWDGLCRHLSSAWAGADRGIDSFPPHHIQEGCPAHLLSVTSECSFHLENVGKKEDQSQAPLHISGLASCLAQSSLTLCQFTFFFWASIALRFSSSFILSWIISEAIRWEGSLGEGVTGDGDVIGKGGVDI